MQTVSKEERADKARALRSRVDDAIGELAQAVDDVKASDMFQSYLECQAKFHAYSFANVMLILGQKPSATRVAGYRTWQKLKRQVKRGERGIAIFAPCPFKREVENENGETEEREGIFFKVVHVFDVSQTEGEALPELDCPNIGEAADKLLADLCIVGKQRGIAIEFKALNGPFGSSGNGAVKIDPFYSTGQQAKTLAHELANEALHWEKGQRITRDMAELEAESVAYVVCRHFGLDTSVRSSRYIALYRGDSERMAESMERIATTARAMIDDVQQAQRAKVVV